MYIFCYLIICIYIYVLLFIVVENCRKVEKKINFFLILNKSFYDLRRNSIL